MSGHDLLPCAGYMQLYGIYKGIDTWATCCLPCVYLLSTLIYL